MGWLATAGGRVVPLKSPAAFCVRLLGDGGAAWTLAATVVRCRPCFQADGGTARFVASTGCGVLIASRRHRRRFWGRVRAFCDAFSASAWTLWTHAQPATWITSDGPPQGRCARPSVSIDWPGVSAMLERGCQVRDALMVDGSPLPSLPGLPDKQSPPTTARPCPGPRA